MKQWQAVTITLLLLGVGLFWWDKTRIEPKASSAGKPYVVAGSANPGEIILYKLGENTMTEQKRINTGYKFVFTVRVGDIYNTGKSTIIAGVGDSFYKDPYGCHVIAYDLNLQKIETIDTLSDLRCKDLVIDDLDQDGTKEVVLATHGEGYIRIYRHIADEWQKEEVEHNFIAQIDQEESQNHRVSNVDLPCDDCLIQSAVHIVKAVDTDGRGEKEIIATISSPLELQGVDEVSFVMLYRRKNGVWEKEIIDRGENFEFRSIEIGDIDNNGFQDIVVGTGSPRDVSISVFAYEHANGAWSKKEVFTDANAKNMKGLVVTDYDQNGEKSIILATGFPDSTLYHISWDGSSFVPIEIDRISSLLQNGGQHNAMAAFVIPDTQNVITAGMSTFPEQMIGWEASEKGFIAYYSNKNGILSSNLVDTMNILGMDLFTE